SRWVQERTSRERWYSRCASSTCSAPSRVCARSPKMSRIRPVRSMTLQPHSRSRLRCCTGLSAVSTMATVTEASRSAWPCVAAWPSPSSIDGRRPRNGTIAVCTTTSPIEAASPTASASRASAARVASCRSARSQGRMTAARVGRLEPAPFSPPFMPSRSLNDGSGWLAHRAAFGLRGVEQLDRRARHHGADRVLVDELRVSVPAEQDGEIVEPGDDALQLDAVDQEHGHGGLVLPHMVQEDVLNVLRFLVGHGAILLLLVDVVACYRHLPSWHADRRHHILAAALPCASARSRAAKPCACSKCRSAPARSMPPSCVASPIRTAVTPAARAASMSFAVS